MPTSGGGQGRAPALEQPPGQELGPVLLGDPFTKRLGRSARKLALFSAETTHKNICAWGRREVVRPQVLVTPRVGVGHSGRGNERSGSPSDQTQLPTSAAGGTVSRPQTPCLSPGGARLVSAHPGSTLRERGNPLCWARRKERVTHRVSRKLASEQL